MIVLIILSNHVRTTCKFTCSYIFSTRKKPSAPESATVTSSTSSPASKTTITVASSPKSPSSTSATELPRSKTSFFGIERIKSFEIITLKKNLRSLFLSSSLFSAQKQRTDCEPHSSSSCSTSSPASSTGWALISTRKLICFSKYFSV